METHTTHTRREKILQILQSQKDPISASGLAQQMGVSRQVIVGDIAILRAQGSDIIAMARGYALGPLISAGRRYIGKIACLHDASGTYDELSAIVNLGGEVIDVIVEHEIYGEIA